tara:strand:+ start:150 stop:275 length:126 start_codon:yes stop_codon:yes gene_type:complete
MISLEALLILNKKNFLKKYHLLTNILKKGKEAITTKARVYI